MIEDIRMVVDILPETLDPLEIFGRSEFPAFRVDSGDDNMFATIEDALGGIIDG